MILLAAFAIQIASAHSQAWEERHHPDMPVLPACELHGSVNPVTRMADLPADVAMELHRFFGPAGGLSDADGLFNSTDVIGDDVPGRRFIRAYHVGGNWVIWYERGGFIHNNRTIALRSQRERQGRTLQWTAEPATTFVGDLCAATKAIASGVRTGTP